jgi:glutamine amidotransferase-like uncharacterized protein
MATAHDIYELHEFNDERLAARERVNSGRLLHYPKIGIYTGVGTSHSWLWFVDLFERLGFYDLLFLNEDNIRSEELGGIDVLVISGGDTFAVAKGLGKRGSDKLKAFIRNGGLYIGTCAGAYLPLNSSKEYLNLFNYVNAKISNLTKNLPEAKEVPEKFCTPYGCSFIFHPIREEVKLRTNGIAPFQEVGSLVAPLYGGPSMLDAGKVEVLAYYEEFTDKTVFLVNEEIARNIVIGKAAVVRKKMGEGHLYLFGPHFEHPHYPMANKLVADVIYYEVKETSPNVSKPEENVKSIEGTEAKKLIRDVKRELSNSRIVNTGLEVIPVHWLIGNKTYEPGKISVFLEAMWKRIRMLERWGKLTVRNENAEAIVECASDTTILLREIKKDIGKRVDTVGLATQLFSNLSMLSSVFLDTYFRTKMREWNDKI